MPDNDIRLLALDGGGVRGLSSLMILRSLMAAIHPDSPPKPCDYFDMIGGTSTGGLIAVMLGRLCMSVDDCISAYISLSDEVFKKKSHRLKFNGKLQGRFDTGALERAVKQILTRTGHNEDTLLKDTSGKCKVFVCATSQQTSDTVCLTSYRTSRSTDLLDTTTVWQACRATSAASTFFDPISIGTPPEYFIDGALGMNNPIFALWNQAQDVWGDRLRGSLRCLVSIGTGVPALNPVADDALGILSTLKEIATETERTAELFNQYNISLDNDGRYFRFNVAHGLEHIGLEESKKQTEIGAATRRYVQSQAVLKQVTAFAERRYVGPYKTPFSLAGVPVSAKFVDRPSYTASLEECLLPQHLQRGKKKVFVLHGLGGFGKTQLAVDFARRHQATFSSVFWLDGRSEDRLKRSFAKYLSKITDGQLPSATQQQAKGRTPEDLDAAVASVMEWLGRPDNCDWLLVFDNIDQDHEKGGSGNGNDAENAYDVTQYLPWDHGAVLITTRVSRLSQLAAPGNSRKLSKADSSLSRAILEAWYGGQLGHDADELLPLLDGLPLALAQAASYLQETEISIAKYLEIYRNQWAELMASESSYPLLDYEQGTVATTWTVSFLQIEAIDESAANLLRLWAFLDNKGIEYGLLKAIGREDSSGLQCPEWLRELAVSEVRFLKAIRLLLRYSLIEAQDGTTHGYSMHPVVHNWVLCHDSSGKAGFARLALAVVGLSVPRLTDTEYWVLQQRLLPHALRCAEREGNGSVDSVMTASKDVLSHLHCLGHLLRTQGKLAEAEAIHERALVGCETVFGRDHKKTLTNAANLGLLYKTRGKLAMAEVQYRRALVGLEKTLGRDHTDTLCIVNNLGQLYYTQGKLGEAEVQYLRALEGFETTLGRDDTNTLITVSNLGLLYDTQRRPVEAEAQYLRALEGLEKVFGPNHTFTLTCVNNLGSFYTNQNKLTEAKKLCRRALAGREAALGSDHPETLSTVNNLGAVFLAQGKLDEAENMFQRALDGREIGLVPGHPDTLLTVKNLGVLLMARRKLDDAETMLWRALDGLEKALGSHHSHTLDTAGHLGALYMSQGKLAQAVAIYQRAFLEA